MNAIEARLLSKNGELDLFYDQLLELIKEAAMRGDRSVANPFEIVYYKNRSLARLTPDQETSIKYRLIQNHYCVDEHKAINSLPYESSSYLTVSW